MNSSATTLDRAFAALAYAMPLASAFPLGLAFLAEYTPREFFNAFIAFMMPIMFFSDGIIGLAIFVLLFAFVVRNPQISRFIRFNVLQAILVSFMISIMAIVFGLPLFPTLVQTSIFNTLFLGGVIIVVYGVIQSALGRYADIPTISDAINMQLPN